ncbi:hypothetical protein N0V90_006639 [Kalmusia sp. IMI 367209]|nr:hypothetical protein N0V90_006639 [Kalmusia sp. IMI 367209]
MSYPPTPPDVEYSVTAEHIPWWSLNPATQQSDQQFTDEASQYNQNTALYNDIAPESLIHSGFGQFDTAHLELIPRRNTYPLYPVPPQLSHESSPLEYSQHSQLEFSYHEDFMQLPFEQQSLHTEFNHGYMSPPTTTTGSPTIGFPVFSTDVQPCKPETTNEFHLNERVESSIYIPRSPQVEVPENPLTCSLCFANFNGYYQKGNLKRHIKSCHPEYLLRAGEALPDKKKLQCMVCAMTFKRSDARKKPRVEGPQGALS